MKCRYIYDPKAGKVLIPGCMGVAVSNNFDNCTCRQNSSFSGFEKSEFNKILKQKEDLIKDLESENARLNRIIKKLIKKQ